MKKEETIRRHGIGEYEKRLNQNRKWNDKHPEERKASHMNSNPQSNRKGGKYYEKTLGSKRTGLPGKKNRIRTKHGHLYCLFKRIIAPESQIHHQWIPGTADYTGIALVEKDAHMQGFVDVIRILEGEITLLTEAEIRGVIERNG